MSLRREEVENIIKLLSEYSIEDQVWILSGVLERMGVGATITNYLGRTSLLKKEVRSE